MTDLTRALDELARVAGRAVVITVPHDKEGHSMTHTDGVPHAHLRSFTDTVLKEQGKRLGLDVYSRRILHPLSKWLGVAVEATPRSLQDRAGLDRLIVRSYNAVCRPMSRLTGRQTLAALMSLDSSLCQILRSYDAVLVVMLKDAGAWSSESLRQLAPEDVIDFSVPLHMLDAPTTRG